MRVSRLPPGTIVKEGRARSTKTRVYLQIAEGGPDYEGGVVWETVCEDHSGVVGHQTRAIATSYLSHPEDWCPGCQELEEAKAKALKAAAALPVPGAPNDGPHREASEAKQSEPAC